MFFRIKSYRPRTHPQVIENHWEGGRSRRRVITTLGWFDQLRDNGDSTPT